MNKAPLQILLIADFNIENLAELIKNDNISPPLTATVAPYDQVTQILMDGSHELWRSQPQYALIWTSPEKISPAFARLKKFESATSQEVAEDVDRLTTLLAHAAQRTKALFVPTWTIPASEHGLGALDMKADAGIRRMLQFMIERFAGKFDNAKNIFVLDAGKWVSQAGHNAYNPKLWYLGKILFSNEVFVGAKKDIKAAINGIEGRAKKLIVVDLDDTLWGGIVGDVGWENVNLGGHDPVGEAYRDFQLALKALTNRGILLGIVSKNDENIAVEAITKHPEMILRTEDFAGWKINWGDKAQNLAELVGELNLGLESVVFIDDNAVERARVRESFHDVLVPEMPEDKLFFPSLIKSLHCFESPIFSEEDRHRTEQYRTEQKRKSFLQGVESMDDWLKRLQTIVSAEPLKQVNLERTTQLLNKTNQMNLVTRRMTAEELMSWAKRDNHELWTVRVRDKFGDSGLVGIMGLEFSGEAASFADFVLSCRVMGRRVEEAMLYLAVARAKHHGCGKILAVFHQTERNNPCLEFWKRSRFTNDNKNSNSFHWDTSNPYELQGVIKLEM